MDYFDVLAWLIIFGIIGNSIVFSFEIIEKKNFGKIILRVDEKGSMGFFWIGLVIFFISILNLWTLSDNFSISMKIMNWIVYPAISIWNFYIWIIKIQFRENGIIWRNFSIKYSDIVFYKWVAPGRLEVVRKTGLLKKFNIQMKQLQDRPEIDKYLEEKVKDKYQMIDNFSN